MTSIPRRRGGPLVAVLVDLFRQARLTGSWVVALLMLLALVAVVIGVVTQVVVPWLIYPAL